LITANNNRRGFAPPIFKPVLKENTMENIYSRTVDTLAINEKALEIAVNQEREKDSQFDNKTDYYNFLVDAFYGVLDSSPMEMAEKNPELNNEISKLLSKLMEEKFGA
jgi:hypothetical protein